MPPKCYVLSFDIVEVRVQNSYLANQKGIWVLLIGYLTSCVG